MKSLGTFCFLVLLTLSFLLPDFVAADDEAAAEKYLLRYKLKAGESLRWKVVHQATITSTIQGTTQTADTRSESVKVWKINEVTADDEIVFEHLVESVKMSNQLPNRATVEYDSTKDKKPPVGFEDAARAVGVPLTEVRIDRSGKVLRRLQKHIQPGQTGETPIAIPLPDEAVPVGHVWSEPHEIKVTLPGGRTKQVSTRRRFELRSVKSGVARIAVNYQVLTPTRDPAIEAQLAQRLSGGEVRFDVDAGRIIGQRLEVDKQVLEFSGPGSSMHYKMRFTEELLKPSESVAEKPAGPDLPPNLK